MVRTRLVLGLSLIAGMLLLAWLDSCLPGGPLFHVLAGVVLAWGLAEFYTLAERQGRQPLKQVAVPMAVGLVALDYVVRMGGGRLRAGLVGPDPTPLALFYSPMAPAAVVAVGAVLLGHVFLRDPRRWLSEAPVTSLGLLYVWFLGAHAFGIREFGMGHVLAFLAVAKLGDAGAYFVGLHWGRHRLAPSISPKKTVEGALAGLAASVAVGVVAWALGLEGGVVFWLAFGLVVGAAAQAGDLVESALKRSAGVKDSGQVFPQFGGALDVIDSLLLSAPVAFWMLALR